MGLIRVLTINIRFTKLSKLAHLGLSEIDDGFVLSRELGRGNQFFSLKRDGIKWLFLAPILIGVPIHSGSGNM